MKPSTRATPPSEDNFFDTQDQTYQPQMQYANTLIDHNSENVSEPKFITSQQPQTMQRVNSNQRFVVAQEPVPLRQNSVGRFNPLLAKNGPSSTQPVQYNQGYSQPQNESIADNSGNMSRMSNASRSGMKSPLRVNVLNNQSSNSMRKSPSNRSLLAAEYSDDVATLKLIYLARNEELKHLNEQIAILEGGSREDRNGVEQESEQQIMKLENEQNRLLSDNDLLRKELEQSREKIKVQTADFEAKISLMKTRFQENARKNMEMYERELMFKYRNNDEETIKYLKEKIEEFEKR